VLGLGACSSRPAPTPLAPTPAPVAAAPERDSLALVDSLLASLTLEQKAAQVVMPLVSGAYAAADDSALQVALRWVDSLGVGGLVVSGGSPFDIAEKLNALQRRSRVPLLVSADLEWGAGMRLRGGTAFPMMMAIGATGNPADAYMIGEAAALEGRAVGIQVNFAPDADLNNNPLNPIINVRSFGESPAAVAPLVEAYVRGLEDHGMIATLKHFPGHGDTREDSHIGLPVVMTSYQHLDSAEFVPFRAGIRAGAGAIMSAHIALPAVTGSDDPATLSSAVLTGLLRDSLRFQGLVVTDALTMGAITTRFGAADAAARAFAAGSDLLLMPSDADSAVLGVTAAVADGRVPLARLDQSVRRLVLMKWRLGLFARRTVSLDSLPETVGARRFRDEARDLAVRALTLVRDSGSVLAGLRARRSRIALIAYGDELNANVGSVVADVLRHGGDTVGYFRLWPMSGTLSYDSARATLARGREAVFITDVRPLTARGTIALPDSMADLIAATDRRRPTVLVSLGSPYLLDQTTAKSYLLAWSGVTAAERAVGLALLGTVPIGGHLPIRLPPAYPVGWGLQLPTVP